MKPGAKSSLNRTKSGVAMGPAVSQRSKAKHINVEVKQANIRQGVRREEGAPVLAEYVQMLESVQNKNLTEKTWFCVPVCIETVLCLIALGVQADYQCRNHCTALELLPWRITDNLFTAFGVVEILVGVLSSSPKDYFVGRPRKGSFSSEGAFHSIDAVLVLCRVLDVWFFALLGIKSNLKLLSAFRVMHLGWFASQFQLVRIFRELWLIMAGMLDTLKTVVWVVVLLLMVLGVFGIMLKILISNSIINYSPFMWQKDDLWGSVPKSVFTLFQVLTNDNWSGHVVWPLVEANMLFGLVFLAFYILANIALMNTVVGAIVESTLRSSRLNEERNQRERQRLDVQLMSSLENVFNEADTDGNGELDRDELRAMLKQLHVKKTVNMLSLRGRDLDGLFSILDTDLKDVVKTDLFFRGCARLRGPAMARDLEILGNDFMRQCDNVDMHVSKVKTTNDLMSEIVDVIEKTDKSVVRYDGDQEDPVIMARRDREHVPATKRLRTVQHLEEVEVLSETSSTIYRRPGAFVSKMNASRWGAWAPAPPPIPHHIMELELDEAWGNAEVAVDVMLEAPRYKELPNRAGSIISCVSDETESTAESFGLGLVL